MIRSFKEGNDLTTFVSVRSHSSNVKNGGKEGVEMGLAPRLESHCDSRYSVFISDFLVVFQ